jgi:hypothetical protein
MQSAEFHFTAVPGKSLNTTDVTPAGVAAAFQSWYASSTSDGYGTTFIYTQPFTISGDASDVRSVTVTLTNSQGVSEPMTSQ